MSALYAARHTNADESKEFSASIASEIATPGEYQRLTLGLGLANGGAPSYCATEFSRSGCGDSEGFSTRFSGKYALITYCSSMRCVLKKRPVQRNGRTHDRAATAPCPCNTAAGSRFSRCSYSDLASPGSSS